MSQQRTAFAESSPSPLYSMPPPRKLPTSKLQKVRELEAQLLSTAKAGSLKKAKVYLAELSSLLEPHNHKARLMENYLIFYEAALELWELDLARSGLLYVISHTNRSTRLYLEAKTLLAIAFLRKKDILSAEPHIADVLKNDRAISSAKQRAAFRRETIDRFDQEGAIAALAGLYPGELNEAKLTQDALALLREGKFEDQLEEELGASIPEAARNFILKVDELSKNQLPSTERLMLPSPRDIATDRRLGNILFSGLKRRLYPHLCDPESEVQKRWIGQGIDGILGGGFLVSITLQAATDLRIAAPAIIATVTALVAKRGLNNFCRNNKPRDLMSLRRSRTRSAP